MAPRNILVLAEGQMGDLLLLTPALRAMKETYPSASVTVVVLERRSTRAAGSPMINGPLGSDDDNVLATNSHVDRLFAIDRAGLTSLRGMARIRAEAAIVRFLRAQKFDTVLSTFNEDRFLLWAFASGAGLRVGARGEGLTFLLNRTPAIRKDTNGVRAYYCDLARSIGVRVASERTEYAVPRQALEKADEFLAAHGLMGAGNIVAVHPGATGNYKIWPPERYAEVIDTLQTSLRAKVIVLCGPQDGKVVEDVVARARTDVAQADCAGSIGDCAALVKRSAMCLSNDSGPRHLAAAVGTPSLALFRRHHDREWGVYDENERCAVMQGGGGCPACPPGECRDLIPEQELYGSHCLRMIPVVDVVARVQGMLRRA